MVILEVKAMFAFGKTFSPVIVFKKSNVPMIVKKIAGVQAEGRSIYGYFLTDNEIDRIFPRIHEDYYTMPLWNPKRSLFKKGKDIYMREILKKADVPIRKIKSRHILGWSFKE
ncbi:MAG: hypothetical protein KAU07_03230 [Candidatus Andersenbacteria bacterium]|nr:hypothetical protein [Candidatus Andersenbacteria bacterium]